MNTVDIVKAAREARGLTRKQLADRSGVNTATIWNIEKGKVDPRMSTMLAIFRVLDYDIVFNPRYRGGYIDER